MANGAAALAADSDSHPATIAATAIIAGDLLRWEIANRHDHRWNRLNFSVHFKAVLAECDLDGLGSCIIQRPMA